MKYSFLIIGFALLLVSCGGSKKADDVIPTPPAPQAATLVFPAQNAVCISGSVLSASQSTIQFQWNSGANADNYVVVTKNLLTGDSLATAAGGTNANLTLSRNTPYSWYVISKSSQGSSTAKSATWKFYNAGAGITTYAPFPADDLNPAEGQAITVPSSGQISLSWKGSSVDNDIVDYDIYFGTAASPPLYKSHNTAQSIGSVPAVSKSTYYWKIVTRDSNNNTSTSDVIEFTTK
jgi:hypothetical protein